MSNTQTQAFTGQTAQTSLPPLPRITIHAFCETQEGVALMQHVMTDRRMTRTSHQVFTGGIPAAVQAYAQALTPELLIIETAKDSATLLGELQSLAQVCAPQTKVVIIGHHNDIQLYRMLITQGISDYLVMPLRPEDVISSVAPLFITNAGAAPLGRIVAFIGARGGAGSSTVAHNVSWILAEQFGKNTIVADFDLAYGTAGLDFDKDPVQGILEALLSSERIDPVFVDRLLTKCTEHLMLLASPANVEKVIDIRSETLDLLLDALRATAPFAVLDLPSDWESWTKAALVNADDVIITATPDLVSVRNVKSILDQLKQLRPNDSKPGLVLNRVGQSRSKELEITMKEFEDAFDIVPLGSIPFEPDLFNLALNEGTLVARYQPQSDAARVFAHVAHVLLGQEEENVEDPRAKTSQLLRPLQNLLQKVTKKKG